jgi:hypothetical protein
VRQKEMRVRERKSVRKRKRSRVVSELEYLRLSPQTPLLLPV